MPEMRIAIIGGGIAGLAAAYELEKARAAGAPVEYTLFEARERLGGSLASEIVNGAVLERGPDSFLTEKPAAAELCRELGLGADLLPSNDAARKTYILVRNRLVALPDGLMFLVPTKLIPTALTRLFSFHTKVRMALELLHPPRPSGLPDEAVAALVERHFGAEAVDRLADPLLSGIYGGDAAAVERPHRAAPPGRRWRPQYGSLTRGMLAAHRQMRARAKACRTRQRPLETCRATAPGHLHRAARRNAAVGRCPCGAARSGLAAPGHAGELQSKRPRKAGRSSTPAAQRTLRCTDCRLARMGRG